MIGVAGINLNCRAHPHVSPGQQEHPEVLREGDEGVAEGEGAAGAQDGGPLAAHQVGERPRRQAAAQHAEGGDAH